GARKRSARPPTFAAPATRRELSPSAARRVLELAAEFEIEDRAVVERIVPRWMRRERRLDERDEAVRALPALYVETPVATSGHALARAIAAHCRRLPPVDDPRRALIERVLACNGGRPPGEATVRRVLTGLPRYAG